MDPGEQTRDPYPWHLLLRTLLLLNAFLALGINDAIRGPTLLDLRDLVGATIAEMSFIFVLSSVGSLVGCVLTGAVLDRLPRYSYLLLAATLVSLGLANSALPYCPSLPSLYTVALLGGLASGSLDTGGNVLLLHTWSGRDSGPYMHALHFTFGIGAFLAPVVARPFLYSSEEVANITRSDLTAPLASSLTAIEEEEGVGSVWTVKTLYPLVGAYAGILSLGFVAYHLRDVRKEREGGRQEKKVEENTLSKSNLILMVALFCVLYFLYVGMEVAFGTFVPVFAVQSGLKFTRKQASDVAAVFWGSFAVTRGLAIFAAIVASPDVIMWGSFGVSGLGQLVLLLWADTHPEALYCGTALLGMGMASIFATGFLWVERRTAVTARVGAAFMVASSSGADVFPVVVGQMVEEYPMGLLYLTSGIWAACVLIFAIITATARGGRRAATPQLKGELPLEPLS